MNVSWNPRLTRLLDLVEERASFSDEGEDACS